MRVVHIGYPKTGTTFLQRHVFPQLADYAFFGVEASGPLFTPLMHHDDTIFDGAALERRIDEVCRGCDNVLFSYEPLTGLEYRTGFVNRTLIAKRLLRLGFERVIITIRNQFDVLESTYKQYVQSGGVLKLDRYLTFNESETRYLYPQYFDYFSIHRLYAEIFGGSNVLLLQFEHLREPSFMETLSAFCGTTLPHVAAAETVNPSLSRGKTALLRLINHATYNAYRPSHLLSARISTSFFHRLLAAVPFGNGRGSLLDAATRAKIAAYYSDSNTRLAKAARVDLSPEYPSER